MDANKKSLTPGEFSMIKQGTTVGPKMAPRRAIPYILHPPAGHWIEHPLKKSIQKFEIIDGYFIYLREQIYREWAIIKFSLFYF